MADVNKELSDNVCLRFLNFMEWANWPEKAGDFLAGIATPEGMNAFEELVDAVHEWKRAQ